MTRISALLGKAELAALLDMATADCRRLREQMRCLLREEAKRRGPLPADRHLWRRNHWLPSR